MRRDHKNYPGFTRTVPEPEATLDLQKVASEGLSAVKTIDLFVIPASINLTQGSHFRLQFKSWKSIEHFEERQPHLIGNDYLKTLRVGPELFGDFYAENKAAIDLIHAENLNFLGVSGDEYDSTTVVIDIDTLTISSEAVRKGVGNQIVRREVSDPAEFEAVKKSVPDFATALLNFAVQYGMNKSGFLRKLTPVQA